MSFYEFFFLTKGRISRQEFFIRGFIPLTLLLVMNGILLNVLNIFILNNQVEYSWLAQVKFISFFLYFIIIYMIISVAIKRFHDYNKSGWYVLFLFIPLMNIFVTSILIFKNSSTTNTRYDTIISIYKMNGLRWALLVFNLILLFISIIAFGLSKNITLPSNQDDNSKDSIYFIPEKYSLDRSTISIIKSKNYILKIDTLGRIYSKVLLNNKAKTSQINLTEGIKPLYLRFKDERLNREASSIAYTASKTNIFLNEGSQKVILTQKLRHVVVTKEITFYPDGHYDIIVTVPDNLKYYIYLGSPLATGKKSNTIIYNHYEKIIINNGSDTGRHLYENTKLIAYFSDSTIQVMYSFLNVKLIIVEPDNNGNPIVYFECLNTSGFSGYIGVKKYDKLKNINSILTDVIDFSWFSRLFS